MRRGRRAAFQWFRGQNGVPHSVPSKKRMKPKRCAGLRGFQEFATYNIGDDYPRKKLEILMSGLGSGQVSPKRCKHSTVSPARVTAEAAVRAALTPIHCSAASPSPNAPPLPATLLHPAVSLVPATDKKKSTEWGRRNGDCPRFVRFVAQGPPPFCRAGGRPAVPLPSVIAGK